MSTRHFPIPAAAGLVLTSGFAVGCFETGGGKGSDDDTGAADDTGSADDTGGGEEGADSLEGSWNLETVDEEPPGYTYVYDGCTITYSYSIVLEFGVETDGDFTGTWTSSYVYSAEGDACETEGTYASEPVVTAATASRTGTRQYAIEVSENSFAMECTLDDPSQALECATSIDGVAYDLGWSAQ